MRSGPVFDSIRNLQVRCPEERRLGERDGEPKIRRKGVEPIKEESDLLKGPDNGDIINVGRDCDADQAVRGTLKDRLETEAE
jgi:hypothetical protein